MCILWCHLLTFYKSVQLELRSKEDSQLVQRIIEALSGGGEEGSLPEELEAELTPEVLVRIEVQLIKAVMANGQLKVCVCGSCVCTLCVVYHYTCSCS